MVVKKNLSQKLSAELASEVSVVSPLLADVREACRILGGVSARWLWSATKAGTVPHVRLGRRVLYPVDGLREFVAGNTR